MSALRGFLRVTIDAEPGWHVGADEDHLGGPGALLERDSRPHLPVTSLVGSLREHLRHPDPSWADEVCQILGCELDGLVTVLLGPEAGDKATNSEDAEGLTASPTWGLDIDITHRDGSPLTKDDVVERGRTAIDRHRGAAHAFALWQGSEVAVPTCLVLRLRLDRSDDELQAVATALLAWRPTLGGGTTTGSGRARVIRVEYGSINLSTRAGRVTLWSYSGPALVDAVATTVATGKNHIGQDDSRALVRQKCLIDLDLRVTNGIPETSNRGSDDAQRGQTYLVHLGDDYIIPGTTWKGLVRSRFEYVLRTAVEAYCRTRPDEDQQKALDAVACTDRFACAQRALEEAQQAQENQTDRVLPGGCITCRVFGSQNRAGEVIFENSIVSTVEATSRSRNSINRFSGGVENLFAETTLKKGAQGKMGCELVIDRMPPKRGDLLAVPSQEAPSSTDAVIRKVLNLVLRDFGEGLVGVGSRVSTGLGTLVFPPSEQQSADVLNAEDVKCLLHLPQVTTPRRPGPAKDEPDTCVQSGASCIDPSLKEQTAFLVGYGELLWSEVATILKGMKAVWFGLEDPAIRTVPSSPPVGATHLWAWDDNTLARVRIQDDRAIVAKLFFSESDVPSSVPNESVTSLACTVIESAPMLSDRDGRMGMNPGTHELAKMPTTVYIVQGATPLEFVKITER